MNEHDHECDNIFCGIYNSLISHAGDISGSGKETLTSLVRVMESTMNLTSKMKDAFGPSFVHCVFMDGNKGPSGVNKSRLYGIKNKKDDSDSSDNEDECVRELFLDLEGILDNEPHYWICRIVKIEDEEEENATHKILTQFCFNLNYNYMVAEFVQENDESSGCLLEYPVGARVLVSQGKIDTSEGSYPDRFFPLLCPIT